MTETTKTPRPIGEVAFRLLRNVKPGQYLYPVGWSEDPGDRWALVEGHPLTLEFQNVLDGGRRKECQVMVWRDDLMQMFVGQPDERIRIITPPKPKAAS